MEPLVWFTLQALILASSGHQIDQECESSEELFRQNFFCPVLTYPQCVSEQQSKVQCGTERRPRAHLNHYQLYDKHVPTAGTS